MDLRPQIAADIVDAILDDMDMEDPERRARWIAMAESKIVSHSIDFPKRGIVSDDPQVIEAFLSKYPVLRPYLAKIRVKADELEPGVRVTLEVQNDPEMCHVCQEGQTLICYVLFQMKGGVEDPVWQEKNEALMDWWGDQRVPAVSSILHLSARWAG